MICEDLQLELYTGAGDAISLTTGLIEECID